MEETLIYDLVIGFCAGTFSLFALYTVFYIAKYAVDEYRREWNRIMNEPDLIEDKSSYKEHDL